MTAISYPFFTKLSRTLNSGQSHSVIVSGNVMDLFFLPSESGNGKYVPLLDFLIAKYTQTGVTLIAYELNGPIRFINEGDYEKTKNQYAMWRATMGKEKSVAEYRTQFETQIRETINIPGAALEFLRQLTLCNRQDNSPNKSKLLILIEGADMRIPAGDGEISRLSEDDRRKIGICQDWFSDPDFMDGNDSVVMLSETRSLIHPKVSRLPQVLDIEVASPNAEIRDHYIQWFYKNRNQGMLNEDSGTQPSWNTAKLAGSTAGVSIQSLRQLLVENEYNGGGEIPADLVVSKVEEYIKSQVGDDVVEFKKPSHTLDDVVGFTKLKKFIRDELIPRFQSEDPSGALSGAAVAGAIGGGKTFIFEAVSAEMDVPVIVLKAIRSQWYGQTDVIFERLRRVLESLGRVMIFVDEADTQFGQVSADAHETERRLTGAIQGMMSDTRLKGKVIWLLMTARIELLSPDIRRPGRAGDLIIPVLDPESGKSWEDNDRIEFIRWLAKPFFTEEEMKDLEITRIPDEAEGGWMNRITPLYKEFDDLTKGWSAATFASVRSQAKGRKVTNSEGLREIIADTLEPDIASTRRKQTLQALLNCTRRSLLPNGVNNKEAWRKELLELEMTQ